MRIRKSLVMLMSILAFAGCSKDKSTNELIAELNSADEDDRIRAVRLLPQHKRDATKVVPALIESLNDKHSDIRWSAAIGLGYFGTEAKSAVAALQKAQRDSDARVREAARVAISRIESSRASQPP